jgi:hypothetical protein
LDPSICIRLTRAQERREIDLRWPTVNAAMAERIVLPP